MHSHGFALLCLAHVFDRCEPTNDKNVSREQLFKAGLRDDLARVMSGAVAFNGKAQSTQGGWFYTSKAEGHDSDERHQTALQFQALATVRAVGIPVPQTVMDRAETYLERSFPVTTGNTFKYELLSPQPPAMAAALAAILYNGKLDSPLVKKWLPHCPQDASGFKNIDMEAYFHCHYAQVMHRLGDGGYAKLFPESKKPLTWSAYRKVLFEKAARWQEKDGSWPRTFGPVFGTANMLIALQVENGHFPLTPPDGKDKRRVFLEPTPEMVEDAGNAIRKLKGKFHTFADRFDMCVADLSVLSDPELARFPDIPFRFELWLRASDIPEQDSLAHLKRLPSLTRLKLFGIHWTGKHWDELATLNDLRELHVRSAQNLGDVDWKPLKNLTSLGLGSSQASGKGLKALSNLQKLYLESSKITDDGMRDISGLPDLKELDLRGTPITDDMVTHLARLAKLRRLVLAQPRITDRGLEQLAGLKDFSSLELYQATVSGKGLKSLPRLEQLILDGSNLTNDDLREIGKMKHLTVLDLRNNPISDEGIAHLAKLTSLKHLALPGTKITDRALEHLIELKNLRYLDLIGTEITRGGAEKLKKSLPNVTLATDRKVSVK